MQYHKEVGRGAVWTLSTCKQGFGVDMLRDGNIKTYWQSDGPQVDECISIDLEGHGWRETFSCMYLHLSIKMRIYIYGIGGRGVKSLMW